MTIHRPSGPTITVLLPLTSQQTSGRACVLCGVDCEALRVRYRLVGTTPAGAELIACTSHVDTIPVEVTS